MPSSVTHRLSGSEIPLNAFCLIQTLQRSVDFQQYQLTGLRSPHANGSVIGNREDSQSVICFGKLSEHHRFIVCQGAERCLRRTGLPKLDVAVNARRQEEVAFGSRLNGRVNDIF